MQVSLLCCVLTFLVWLSLSEASTPDSSTEVATPTDIYPEKEIVENDLSSTLPPFFETHTSSGDDGESSRHVLCMLGLQNTMIKTLSNTLYDVRQYDPLALGEIPDQYLKEGTLKGLSTLRNISALEVICGSKIVTFTVKVRIDSPYIHYKWEKRVIFLFEGSLWLRADRTEIKLVVEMDSDFKLSLKQAKITNLSGFTFGFSGLGPINPFVSISVNLLEKIWQAKIVGKLEKIVQSELRKEVAKVKVIQ